eukprot:CAMPEP_0168586008 /NCGR_PEP_ID=MMETSP0420-20121227/4039_1 /TAXON_ID=498008 /ORGANISM="Pessonella sp." /LENGTH=196 /DNA_ID=CAMNT_0008621039 /DNA_START=272 /DNA_END=859 /DNA_ORIENTATION=+
MGLNKKENDGKGFTADQADKKSANCSWMSHGAGLQIYFSKFEAQDDPYCDTVSGTCSCFHPDYTILDFMKEPQGGFDTICQFSSFFWQNRQKMNSFLLTKYESLHSDTLGELRRVMKFIGVDASDKHLKEAVAEASFNTMRQKELNGTFGWRLTARNKNDPDTYKTREGKVGAYRQHFDAKTLQMMEQQMLSILPK